MRTRGAHFARLCACVCVCGFVGNLMVLLNMGLCGVDKKKLVLIFFIEDFWIKKKF